MTTLQEQARALGDPTRYRIFRYIADATTPAGVAELTEHVALNHNAVRQHLTKLVEAELVVEDTAPPTGRGRPRLQYWLHPAADSQWGVAGPYERLSLWLSEMLRSGSTAVEVGRRVGRRRRLGPASSDDPIATLVAQMARHGFDPDVEVADGQADITLRTCPFASVALADPDTVCEIHLGMAYGVADSFDGLVVDGLEPHDPREANCRLRCHVERTTAPATTHEG